MFHSQTFEPNFKANKTSFVFIKLAIVLSVLAVLMSQGFQHLKSASPGTVFAYSTVADIEGSRFWISLRQRETDCFGSVYGDLGSFRVNFSTQLKLDCKEEAALSEFTKQLENWLKEHGIDENKAFGFVHRINKVMTLVRAAALMP